MLKTVTSIKKRLSPALGPVKSKQRRINATSPEFVDPPLKSYFGEHTLVSVSYRDDSDNPGWGIDEVYGDNDAESVEPLVKKAFRGVGPDFRTHNPLVQTGEGTSLICAVYSDTGKVIPVFTQGAEFDKFPPSVDEKIAIVMKHSGVDLTSSLDHGSLSFNNAPDVVGIRPASTEN